MDSPWGPLAIADAHVHFFSHRFFSLLAAQKPGLTIEAIGHETGWHMPPEQPERLGDHWAQELDRHAVAQAALIASLPGDEDSVAAAVRTHPGRFFGYFMVNPKAPDAPDRVGRALDSGALRGICLFPAMHGFSMHDPCVQMVLDRAAAGAIVFVHCGVLSVGVRKKLGLHSRFDLRFSNPLDLHAVALANPSTRFVIPHFGAGFFRETLMVADLCSNVYLDTSSSNSWMRYEEAHLDLRAVFRRAIGVVGPSRLLFGTDSSFFPRGWHRQIFEDQAKALYEIGLSAPDARLIFGENLRELFRRIPTK
jgi:predicted TIM-barrel fold metal-dependent hydrolase